MEIYPTIIERICVSLNKDEHITKRLNIVSIGQLICNHRFLGKPNSNETKNEMKLSRFYCKLILAKFDNNKRAHNKYESLQIT